MIYLDLMLNQNMSHLAVLKNDFGFRLHVWQEMLPLHFATNQVNYARCGSFFVEMLKNLDQFHPGLRTLLKKGLTAQARKDMQNSNRSKGRTKYKSRCLNNV